IILFLLSTFNPYLKIFFQIGPPSSYLSFPRRAPPAKAGVGIHPSYVILMKLVPAKASNGNPLNSGY
ncbi:MAG: hypothetical protein CO097_05470, partial [Candidatus Infernicultor aquiphilus]